MKTSIKIPGFLNDLYRDLRDRHLLIPALGLLVALVAVPFVLGKEPKEPPAPPPAPAAADAEATSPAVLADSEVSVRDYRERLEALKSKNPFKQQFSIPEAPIGESASASDAAASAAGSTAAPGSGNMGGAVGTTEIPTSSGTATDNTDGESDSNDVKVVNQLVVRRIDVLAGIQGDARSRKNVKPMTILPDNDEPVVAFLGTDEKGKRAAFAVSSDVSAVAGEGACVPSPGCLFVTLEKGETSTFVYDPNGQTYELTLRAIRDVKVKKD
jgi:hypothetical protein